MLGVLVNTAAILVGGGLGLLFKNRISKRFTDILMTAFAFAVCVMGVSSAIQTADSLGMIVCLALGALLGEALRIEDRVEGLGNRLKRRFAQKEGEGSARFTEAFLSASLLFCIGSMSVMGPLDSGLRGDNAVLFSKSLIDGVTSISYAAALGYGVLFSALPVLVYEGLIFLLASVLEPVLSAAVILEMSAVGGVLLMCVAANMLELTKKRIPVGNMIPCMLLPILYQPLVQWLETIF